MHYATDPAQMKFGMRVSMARSEYTSGMDVLLLTGGVYVLVETRY